MSMRKIGRALWSLGLVWGLLMGGAALKAAPPAKPPAPAKASTPAKAKAAPTKAKAAPTASAPAERATPAQEAEGLSPKAAGIQAYARLQVLIEYYFMQSGRYPSSLEALERSFNLGLPASAPKVDLGKDPLSGKPFLYTPSEDLRYYTLALPEPQLYEREVPILHAIDWGWLAIAAEGKRLERQALECTRSIEGLATLCELYAKDHQKAFPANLESLRPRYMPRELRCPASGKPYRYTFRSGGYMISCPQPQAHGLADFTYDSEKGLIIKELPVPEEKEAEPKEGAEEAATSAPASPPVEKK